MLHFNLTEKWSHRDQVIGKIKWLNHFIRVRIHQSNEPSVYEQQQHFLSTLQTNISYWDNHFRQFAAQQYIENIDRLHTNSMQSAQENKTIPQLASHIIIREIEITDTSYTISLSDDHHLFTEYSLRIKGTLQQQSLTNDLVDIREQYNTITDNISANRAAPIKALEHLINLYADASNSYHHDIADSIPLFVMDLGDHHTCKYLHIMKETTSDPTLQKEFGYWIKAIEAKNVN